MTADRYVRLAGGLSIRELQTSKDRTYMGREDDNSLRLHLPGDLLSDPLQHGISRVLGFVLDIGLWETNPVDY